MSLEVDIFVMDLGADGQFRSTKRQIRSMLKSYEYTTKHATMRMATPLNLWSSTRIIQGRIGLLHVMAHGRSDGVLMPGSSWWRRRGYDVRDTREFVETYAVDLTIDAVLLDACDTFTPTWREHLEALVPPGRTVTWIGTERSVGWGEAATYIGAFYPSLLRLQFPSTPAQRRKRIKDAHERARTAYRTLLCKPCPYRADDLHG